jgi:hypothetical protein
MAGRGGQGEGVKEGRGGQGEGVYLPEKEDGGRRETQGRGRRYLSPPGGEPLRRPMTAVGRGGIWSGRGGEERRASPGW